jgi:hypothetical protein
MAHASSEKALAAARPAPAGRGDAAGAPDASPIFSFLDGAFRGLISRRQEKWNAMVADIFTEIRELAGETKSDEVLNSEHFLTVVTEATLIACRNHDEIKIQALRNAIRNSGLSGRPEEPVQVMFLRLIDYLTPLHLTTLVLLNDPPGWMERHGVSDPRWPIGTSSTVIQYCIETLRGNPTLVEVIVRDLQGAGLVEQGYFLRMPMSEGGMLHPRTTDCGRMFIRYISEP